MDDLGFDWWLDWESVISPNPGTTAGSPPSTSEISAKKKNAASWPGNAAEGGKEERQEVTASLANAKEISRVCPIAPKVCVPRGFLSVVPGERFPNLQKPDPSHSTFCHEADPVFPCRLPRKHVRVLQPAAARQTGTDVHSGFGSQRCVIKYTEE